MLTCLELQKLMQAARKNPRRWLERVFYITTKGNPGQPPVMPLVFNDPQVDINDAILDQRKKSRPPRIIVLKSRQPGVSTLSCGLVTATAWAVPHSTSMILTHLDESSVKMLGKCAFGLDNLPPEIKPVEKRRKTDLIKLDHIQCSDGQVQLNSEIQVSTASGHELWRGMTIRVAHLSEYSRFPYAAKTLGGLLQAVPKTPESLVVIESTANGEGDSFHEEWLRAESGESDFVPIFIPWWKLPDARLPVPIGFRPTKDELDLKKQYKLNEEQLVWYRYVSVTECSGDPDMFNQEFPATPGLAFITTGRPAFPTKPLAEMYERARKKEPIRGEVLETESGPRFSRDGDGCLAIYIPPKAEHEYTIGGDPAAGVEGGDFSCATVYDRQTSEIVAVWHGTITPIEFGQRMMQLGLFYNTAWLAPECNGGCLDGDSLVHTPSGDRRIVDLVGTKPWVFGSRKGRLVLAKAAEVALRRTEASCLRICYAWQAGQVWATGSTVCTPDHPVLLLDGKYAKAENLKPGTRLMPFSQGLWLKQRNGPPRMRIRTGPRGKWLARARWVWEQLGGSVPDRHHIHHLDGDVLNDDPSNLMCVDGVEHNRVHTAAWRRDMSLEERRDWSLKGKASWADPEIRSRRLAAMRAGHKRPEVRARKAAVTAARNRVGGDLWKLKHGGGHNHVVISVEPVGDREVYDMRVPGVENFAVNGIFVHNHGFSVISEMKQCFYPKIYVYTRQDKIRNTITNFLGWETTFRTRGLLFDSMHWALTNHEIMIWDVPTIAEFRATRRMDDNRAEGLKHDDRVFGAMIAYRCHLEMPMQDTGMPPRLRIPPDPKVESILRDLPEEPLAREIWMDTDRILRSISTSHRRALDEYAQMPDLAEEQLWDPTAKSWMPEVPW